MGIEATGKIHTIFETKQISERFSKREFVVEMTDNPKYPQVVLFQLTGDRCSQLDGMDAGDLVEIEFSLRGREWRSPAGELKYFNTLDVWKVALVAASARGGVGGPAPPSPTTSVDPVDDIPFATADLADEPSAISRVLRRRSP